MADKFVSRTDLFGSIVWTPPMASPAMADRVAALLETISIDNDCSDFRSFARALDAMGGRLVLKPDHHGTNDAWTLMVADGTWLAERCREIA